MQSFILKSKTLRKGIEQGVVKFFGAVFFFFLFFLKKVPFLANIGRYPNYLYYTLRDPDYTSEGSLLSSVLPSHKEFKSIVKISRKKSLHQLAFPLFTQKLNIFKFQDIAINGLIIFNIEWVGLAGQQLWHLRFHSSNSLMVSRICYSR